MLALINQEVSEKMFEDNGPIYVHSPGQWFRQPLRIKLNHKSFVNFGHLLPTFPI